MKKKNLIDCPSCSACGDHLTAPWFGNGFVSVVLTCRQCAIDYPIHWNFSRILEEYYNEGKKAAKQEIRDILGVPSK